jgi:hypothetical protein
MHFTDWMVPPQRSGLRATMIHDLGPLRFPENLHPRTVSMHSATAREAANCDVVFANSSYTANDVIERLGLPFERVHVAYPGVATGSGRRVNAMTTGGRMSSPPLPRIGARTAAPSSGQSGCSETSSHWSH